jgi:hypothetical protein
VIDKIEWAEMDKTEIDRGMNRKEIVGQLGRDSGKAAGGTQEF